MCSTFAAKWNCWITAESACIIVVNRSCPITVLQLRFAVLTAVARRIIFPLERVVFWEVKSFVWSNYSTRELILWQNYSILPDSTRVLADGVATEFFNNCRLVIVLPQSLFGNGCQGNAKAYWGCRINSWNRHEQIWEKEIQSGGGAVVDWQYLPRDKRHISCGVSG